MVKRIIKQYCEVCHKPYSERKKAKECEALGDCRKKLAIFRKGLMFHAPLEVENYKNAFVVGVVKRVGNYKHDLFNSHFPLYICEFFDARGTIITYDILTFGNLSLFRFMRRTKLDVHHRAVKRALKFCKSERFKPYFYHEIADEIREKFHVEKNRDPKSNQKSDIRFTEWQ